MLFASGMLETTVASVLLEITTNLNTLVPGLATFVEVSVVAGLIAFFGRKVLKIGR